MFVYHAKNCYIPGCKSRSNKAKCTHIFFYKLPSDSDLCYKWLSAHFVGEKKSIDHPVPTVFPWSKEAVKRKLPTERKLMPPAAKRVKCDEPLTAELNKQLSEVKAEPSEVRAELEAKSKKVVSLQERVQQLECFQVPHNDRGMSIFSLAF